MGNKLDKHAGSSTRFSRLERPSNERPMLRAQSFGSRAKPAESNPSSMQDLVSQKSRNSIAQSMQDRFGSAPKKKTFSVEEPNPCRNVKERTRPKPERLELKELDQAMAFSRQFTETFLQCSLNPPGDYSALFPSYFSLRSQSEIPERFRNLNVGSRFKDGSQNENFNPHHDEFKLLSELFRMENLSAQYEKPSQKSTPFPAKSQLLNRTQPEQQTEKKMRGLDPHLGESKVNVKERVSKVSSSFLMEDEANNALQSPPNKSVLNLRHKPLSQPVHFSPSKSQSQSGKKNSDDSSHQFSNEKPSRLTNNAVAKKGSSTFKINEGHVFSFQKEFGLSNHLSARKSTTPTQVIEEDANDEFEEERSNYMDKVSSLNANFANSKSHPLQSVFDPRSRVNRFGIREDHSFSDSLDKEDIQTPEDEIEETFHRPVQRQSKKQSDFDHYESHAQTINSKPQAKQSLAEIFKGNKAILSGLQERVKQVTVDLASVSKKPEKDNTNNYLANLASQKAVGQNNRYKPPQSSLQSLGDKKSETNPGIGLKTSNSEQKSIASSIKNILNKRDSNHPLESLMKNPKAPTSLAVTGMSNSNTQPKIINKNALTNPNRSDQNTKTYSNLSLTKKVDSKTKIASPPQEPFNMQAKKEKIKETVQQTVQRIRDDASHKKDFSGFSQVKQVEHVQDFESESVELKIYETILGDLHKPDQEHPRYESSKKGHRMSHASRESSKHNIRVNIGDLASQVKFNLDNCFRMN